MFGDARVDELFLSGLSSLQIQATIGKLGRWVERLDLNWCSIRAIPMIEWYDLFRRLPILGDLVVDNATNPSMLRTLFPATLSTLYLGVCPCQAMVLMNILPRYDHLDIDHSVFKVHSDFPISACQRHGYIVLTPEQVCENAEALSPQLRSVCTCAPPFKGGLNDRHSRPDLRTCLITFAEAYEKLYATHLAQTAVS